MNKTLKTLTLALALTSLVMALGSQIPTILPVSPVTEHVTFEKGLTAGGPPGFALSASSRNLKTWWDFEDFMGTYTSAGTISSGIWIGGASGTGSNAYDSSGTASRPGIVELSTGTTNSGSASICIYYSTAAHILFGAGVYTIEGDVFIATLSTAAETYALRFGFGDSIAGAPTDGAYFYYYDVAGGSPTPNWYRNTASNTTLTSTDTGVVAVAGAWTRLKVVVNANASSVEFFINGVSVGSNTVNIPSGAGRGTGAVYTAVKSAGTTARLFNIDWTWLHIDLTTTR